MSHLSLTYYYFKIFLFIIYFLLFNVVCIVFIDISSNSLILLCSVVLNLPLNFFPEF